MSNHETTPLVPSTTDDTLAEIASAIWSVRREEEDRCDMELEDLGQDHSVWREADAVMTLCAGRVVAEPQPDDTVRKFKFDTLVEHCKGQDKDIAALRAELNQARLYEDNAVWHWQHDGQDFLESLTCPVVIPASQLRELLSEKLPTDNMGKPFTYSSTQATNCAGCGKYKHTPLRVDGMDGYVCLTCIDERLESLLDAEPIAGRYIALMPAELQSGHDRVRWAEGLIRQLPEDHGGRNSWLLNYGKPVGEVPAHE